MNITTDSEAIAALKRRAVNLVKEKKLDDAVEALNEIVRLDPRNFQSLFQLAQIFFVQKKYSGSEHMCQQALIAKPNDLRPWLILGNIFVATGNFDKVVNQLPTAISMHPDNFQLNYIVGYGFAKKGELFKAKKYLDAAAKIQPNNPKVKQAMAIVNRAMSAKR